ncbi:phosphoribosyltransferase [Lunatibacter salilacus]|uniref:phosphoribosyltransferase n=1 Tax=Lunatibacter salilacus TaxID=2483804 RepID=UPI00131CE513|nr:phosphoribosyltransferase [Lunatibacter salilacus]
MDEKVPVSFVTISNAIKEFSFPQADLVIGIGSGGTVPASLVAHQLGVPLYIVSVNYRDERNQPKRESPVFLEDFTGSFPNGCSILLVDDVSVTGKTLELVKGTLKEYRVNTFVLKGKADMVLFPTINKCVHWPWHTNSKQLIYEG